MSKRNIWSDDETKLFLQIMKEKKIIQCLDGKRFKVAELFKCVEEEMVKAGSTQKSAEQITLKWKKLKGEFVAVKKRNKTSGESRAECKYFDLLDELLTDRPVVQLLESSNGFDSSASTSQLQQLEGVSVEIEVSPDVNMEDVIESLANDGATASSTPTASVLNGVRNKRKAGMGKVEEWKAAQRELQESFFQKQEKLMKLQFEEEKKMQGELQLKMQESLNSSLANVAKIIMDGISTIFQPNQTNVQPQHQPHFQFQGHIPQSSVPPTPFSFNRRPAQHPLSRIHPYQNTSPRSTSPMQIPPGTIINTFQSSPSSSSSEFMISPLSQSPLSPHSVNSVEEESLPGSFSSY